MSGETHNLSCVTQAHSHVAASGYRHLFCVASSGITLHVLLLNGISEADTRL